MAVYQGARQRTVVLPRRPRVDVGAAAVAATLPRRRTRAAVRARRGPSRMSFVLAAIVIAFAGAFFSLSQDIRVSAPRLRGGPPRDPAPAPARPAPSDLRNELNRLGKAPGDPQARDRGRSRRRSPSPTSSRPARDPDPSMLGRTDSRARAILLLVAFVVVAGALGVRLAYWQVVRRDELAAMAVKQSSTTLRRSRRQRGSIYDRTGTVVLATIRPARPPRGQPEAADARSGAPRSPRSSSSCSASTGEAAANLTTRMTSDREYVVLARDLDARISDHIRDLSTGDQPRALGPHPRARAAAALPAERRRPRHDARGAPARLRQPRGHRPVRRRAVLPGPARRASRRSSRRRRTRPATPCPDSSVGDRGRHPGRGRHAHHRRRPAGRGGAGAPGRLDRRPREAGVRGRHGPVHGRGLRRTRATRPTTPTTTRRSRRQDAGPVRRPDRVHRLRARVGVQDADRDRGPRRRHRHDEDEDQATSGRSTLDGGRTHVDDATTKAMGVMKFEDAIAYSRNVVAAKVALRLGKTTAQASAKPVRRRGAGWASGRRPGSTSPTRSRASSTIRRRRRGARSTSPTAPSARASPSPRSSSRRPTPRWSTAGRSSSRAS